jgi:hypothetical protein
VEPSSTDSSRGAGQTSTDAPPTLRLRESRPRPRVEALGSNPGKLQAMTRAALSFALLSSWLVLLLAGWSLGGAVYLLLVAAVVVFPWRLVLEAGEAGDPGPQP